METLKDIICEICCFDGNKAKCPKVSEQPCGLIEHFTKRIEYCFKKDSFITVDIPKVFHSSRW